jgi:hypothetical protein
MVFVEPIIIVNRRTTVFSYFKPVSAPFVFIRVGIKYIFCTDIYCTYIGELRMATEYMNCAGMRGALNVCYANFFFS